MKKSILLLTLLTSFASFGHNTGTGHTGTENLSVRSLMQKAEEGYPGAQHLLALCYRYGKGGVEKDLDKAIYWYKKAADQGNVIAKYTLKHQLYR